MDNVLHTVASCNELHALRTNEASIDWFHETESDRIAQFDFDSCKDDTIVIRIEGTQKHFRAKLSDIKFKFV